MNEEFLQALDAHSHIGVISHFRPDGDAIGSTLAMGLALRAQGFFNEDGMMKRFAFLEGSELVETVPVERPADMNMLICLDTGDWKRIGDRAMHAFAETPCVVNIDHHETNKRYGHINIVEDAAAACGFVLYRMFREMDWSITPAVATALYTAISTDTGSFSAHHHETTPAVMRAAADLMECGVDVMGVNAHLYDEEPLGGVIVRREVLNNMVLEEGGALVHYSMDAGTRERFGAGWEETKDLVEDIRAIQNVKIAAIFDDLENGVIRVSPRSKDARVSVAEIAARFGGGGHTLAAGIRMKGTLADCRRSVPDAIRAALRHP
ncbi:MAG: bifunctional oligoribonuclease/PAP phosphatase NrnA [Akkermansiaceae bacterium]|nr:bifunctional oligoribonuclease/PAP phosphatase NrnA [Akkermansiaceae bacterium]